MGGFIQEVGQVLEHDLIDLLHQVWSLHNVVAEDAENKQAHIYKILECLKIKLELLDDIFNVLRFLREYFGDSNCAKVDCEGVHSVHVID